MEDKMHIQRVLKYKVLIPRDTRVIVQGNKGNKGSKG